MMTFLVWGVFFFILTQLGFRYNMLEFWLIVLSVAAILVEDSLRRDKLLKKENPPNAS